LSDAKRLKALEDENAKLKKLLAEAMLDNAMLKDIASKKMVTPAARRESVAHLRVVYEVSERRACSALGARPSVSRVLTADTRQVRVILERRVLYWAGCGLAAIFVLGVLACTSTSIDLAIPTMVELRDRADTGRRTDWTNLPRTRPAERSHSSGGRSSGRATHRTRPAARGAESTSSPAAD
jgi:hypothetical protein